MAPGHITGDASQHIQRVYLAQCSMRDNKLHDTPLYLCLCVQFVQSIGLDKRPFHMFGVSMGGNVAGVYAAHYPTHLTSLTLMCPAGNISRRLSYIMFQDWGSNLNLFNEAESQTSPLLLCPLGLIYPTETKFISCLRELERSQRVESIPLIPSTFQEFKDLLTCCSYTHFNFPRQVQSCATWSKFQIKTLLRLFTTWLRHSIKT